MLDDVYRDSDGKMGRRSRRRAPISLRSAPAGRRPRCSTASTSKPTAPAFPLKQVAERESPDGRSLLVTAFDKSVVGADPQGDRTSDLGLNPNGRRRVDPALRSRPLTEERRKELVKIVHKKGRAQGRDPQPAAQGESRDQGAGEEPHHHRRSDQARARIRSRSRPTVHQTDRRIGRRQRKEIMEV